jgi:hypothetical protein
VSARWPNLFVVGAAKAGTTSLCDSLATHPGVFVCEPKEPHFFSAAAHPLSGRIGDERRYLELYRRAGDATVLVDASVSYLWDPASAAAIRRAVPDAKAAVVLRDPVARAYSHYWHAVRWDGERRPLGEAIADELAGRRPALRGMVAEPYVARGRYLPDLQRFHEVFGDDLHVTFFEDLVRDPAGPLTDLFAFLGLDAALAVTGAFARSNEFALPRSRLGRWALTSPPARRLARTAVPPALRRRMVRSVVSEPSRPPAIAPGDEATLRGLYAADRAPLAAFLGRDLPW